MRVNKYLSECGVCSRREADRLLGAGRVAVNGVRARLAQELNEGDHLTLDGEAVVPRKMKAGKRQHVYIALYKPVGITCTTDERVPGNIVAFVGHEARIFPVGRLDKDSEGLILLTSNGDIVNDILRAEHKLEKEYAVAVNHRVTDDFLRGMARGVPVHGQMTLPCRTMKAGAYGFRITLVQGLNRQIRLMASHFGYRVKQLVRVRIGVVELKNLKPGQWRNLTDPELKRLVPGRADW